MLVMQKEGQAAQSPFCAWRTGIGGDVAANLAAALGAQIKWHGESMTPHMAVQFLQNAPRLAHQRPAYLPDTTRQLNCPLYGNMQHVHELRF